MKIIKYSFYFPMPFTETVFIASPAVMINIIPDKDVNIGSY